MTVIKINMEKWDLHEHTEVAKRVERLRINAF